MSTLAAQGAIRITAVRTSPIGNSVLLFFRAALARVVEALAERRRRMEAHDTFHRINARTLRDLGIDRTRAMLTD